MIKLSGAIGLSIYENNKKNVYIFYDSHINKNYCRDDNNIFISDLFNKIIDNNNNIAIIVEEPFTEKNKKVIPLWNNTPHIVLFRSFYKKIVHSLTQKNLCKIYPCDIRLLFFDISFDELIININAHVKAYDITVYDYFKKLLYVFNIITDTICDNCHIVFIKKVFDVFSNNIYYKKLKHLIYVLYCRYIIKNKDKTIFALIKENIAYYKTDYYKGFPFINENNDFVSLVDKIVSSVMELYMCILLLLLQQDNIIIYAGYYHCNNIAYIIEKYFNYRLKYTNGIVDNIEYVKDISSCLIIKNEYLLLKR